MKYLYNPIENGAPIVSFVFNFKKYEHPVGKMLQYEDDVAEEILLTYAFLQDLSRTEVEKKLEELKNPHACEYCEKTFTEKIALSGHMRSHKDQIAEKEAPLDPNIIPLATGDPTNVFNAPQVSQMQKQANPDQVSKNMNDETETDSFYGAGYQETHGK